MIALFVVRAESFHFSTCSFTTAWLNLPAHWRLLTGPYCVVTSCRNSFRALETDGAVNVALKYAVFCDEASAQQATYIWPGAGLGGMYRLMLLKLLLLGLIACGT